MDVLQQALEQLEARYVFVCKHRDDEHKKVEDAVKERDRYDTEAKATWDAIKALKALINQEPEEEVPL